MSGLETVSGVVDISPMTSAEINAFIQSVLQGLPPEVIFWFKFILGIVIVVLISIPTILVVYSRLAAIWKKRAEYFAKKGVAEGEGNKVDLLKIATAMGSVLKAVESNEKTTVGTQGEQNLTNQLLGMVLKQTQFSATEKSDIDKMIGAAKMVKSDVTALLHGAAIEDVKLLDSEFIPK